ncbi:MAG: hypothetical protein PHX66_08420 [Aminobacterium colombiense]|jgi:hypothetical protein|nr:hypothetical protein [Aminobacterium colombiense]MDD3707531.1 hypothetical protein [Aminobacterium sp.]MDD3909482.1 hypothetical protein [Proteiniphilum sp.]
MAGSRKTMSERILETKAKLKSLEKQVKAEKTRQRTNALLSIGTALVSSLSDSDKVRLYVRIDVLEKHARSTAISEDERERAEAGLEKLFNQLAYAYIKKHNNR